MRFVLWQQGISSLPPGLADREQQNCRPGRYNRQRQANAGELSSTRQLRHPQHLLKAFAERDLPEFRQVASRPRKLARFHKDPDVREQADQETDRSKEVARSRYGHWCEKERGRGEEFRVAKFLTVPN